MEAPKLCTLCTNLLDSIDNVTQPSYIMTTSMPVSAATRVLPHGRPSSNRASAISSIAASNDRASSFHFFRSRDGTTLLMCQMSECIGQLRWYPLVSSSTRTWTRGFKREQEIDMTSICWQIVVEMSTRGATRQSRQCSTASAAI